MIKRNLVTQEELDTLAQIDRDCIRMHVCPPPKTFVSMEVQDVDGNVLDSFVMKSNSWVRNAYNAFLACAVPLPCNTGGTTFGEGTLCTKNTAGTVVQNGTYSPVPQPNVGIQRLGGANITDKGIIVGTGDTAETLESHNFAGGIGPGNGTGQLAYSAENVPSASYSSATKKWTVTMTRIFNNNSGAPITVKEAGRFDNLANNGGTSTYALVCRDVLASPVTIPNAGQLTVTYTIEMTFPA